ILRGVLRRLPGLDLVCAQDVGLSRAKEPEVLELAAKEGRILLTHDVSTMTKHAADRLRSGLPMSGVVVVSQSLPVGKAIEDILLLAECSEENEWAGQIRYLPL